MDLITRASHLLERARWKDEGWDRPEPFELLRQWAEDSDFHAVHMSDVGPGDPDARGRGAGGFKVGVNPETDYNTPVGVYTYPLNPTTYNRWFHPDGDRPPFAARRPWMYVLEAPESQTLHVREDGSSGYAEEDFYRFAADITKGETDMVRDTIRGWSSLADNIAQDDLEMIKGDPEAIRDTSFIELVEISSRIQTPFGKLWNFTRTVAREGGNGPSTWTHLLREYLYDDVIVDHGSTLIHNNEPIQAVFLDPSVYETVDVVPNAWDHRALQHSRDVSRMAFEELEDRGLEDLSGKVRWAGAEDREGVEELVEAVAGRGWLLAALRDAGVDEGAIADTITVKLENAGTVTVKHARLEKWDVPVALASDGGVEFASCQFVGCAFGTDYAAAVDGVRVNPSTYDECTFAVDQSPLIDLAVEEGYTPDTFDEFTGAIQDYMAGQKLKGSVANMARDVIEELWGVLTPMFDETPLENCELQVV